MPGGPTKRSIGPLVDDERGLERGAGGEGFVKGMGTSPEGGACGLPASIGATVSACLAGSSATAVIAAASRASLSALSSFRRTTARYSMSRFLIFSRPK